MRHLSLNFSTGLDPDEIRVRNAQGLDAIDFFFPGTETPEPCLPINSAGHRSASPQLLKSSHPH
jgi:hypothetical protein